MEPTLPNITLSRLHIVRLILALAISAVGISVEVGWAENITVLKSIFPGIVSMNPHVALCFIIFAASILLLAYTPKWRKVVLAGAFVIFTFGFVRLLGVLGIVDLRLDQVLFHTQLMASGFNNNRLAPNTAVNLILMSWALASLALNRWQRMVQTLGFVTFMIALFAILGYLYSVKDLYGFLAYTPMALNTALCFIFSATLLFIATADVGLMNNIVSPSPGGVLARRLLPFIVVLPAFVGFFILFGVSAGTFGTAYGLALFVVLILMFFIVLILRAMQTINRIDLVRAEAQARVEVSNKLLDKKLQEQSKQNKELEDVKRATLNLLEDLNSEKTKIEAERAKDEAILGSIGDGVAVADPAGKLIYFNNAAETILGMKYVSSGVKEWEGTFGVFYEDEKTPMPGEAQALALALHGQTVYSMPEFIRNAGVPEGRHITVTAEPIYLKDKTFLGAVAIFRDVTHEREVDKAKTEFVSLASHQLRTPLSAIGWYTEMLMAGDAGKINKEQKKYLEEIYNGNTRMVELVNSLLNVSRLDLGTFVIEPAPTDLKALAEDVAKEQQPAIALRKTKFTAELAGNIPQVPVDVKLMRMVMQNFLSNAIKYTPEAGAVSMHLSMDKKKVIFSVTDSGWGIPDNQKDKIFSKLFRADNVKEHDTEGTGLGLYIVKAVMEQSGGRVWFDSELNKGSTFYAELPVSGMVKKEGTRKLD